MRTGGMDEIANLYRVAYPRNPGKLARKVTHACASVRLGLSIFSKRFAILAL